VSSQQWYPVSHPQSHGIASTVLSFFRSVFHIASLFVQSTQGHGRQGSRKRGHLVHNEWGKLVTQAKQQAIAENRVVIFSKSYCPFCKSAKDLFSTKFPDIPVKVLECVVRRTVLYCSGHGANVNPETHL